MNGELFEKCPTCGFATIYKDKDDESSISLLALAQEQQEELVTGLKTIRTLTKDVEICAIIDALFINLK